MKLGYPCINNSIGCTANSTFRLRNYSKENLIEKVESNLDCLLEILKFNVKNGFFFFRIGSQLVPFASHPVCKFDWQKYFKKRFEEIGHFVKKNKIRISMHPDQFTILNAENNDIVKRSIKELVYHCQILDLMELDLTAKVQIHVGGVYGDKEKSLKRFVENYKSLSSDIKKRFVIENDDKSYSLKDCLKINKMTGIPIVFDVFHHQCLNNSEPVRQALLDAKKTWKKSDGDLIVHYSSQKKEARRGSHSYHINIKDFQSFLEKVNNINFDVMLEIKDKEKSALKALKVVKQN